MATVLILTFFGLGIFWIHSPLRACWLAPSFYSQPLVNPRTPSPPSPAISHISQPHTWKLSPDPAQPKAPPSSTLVPASPAAWEGWSRQTGREHTSISLLRTMFDSNPHGLARKVKRINEEKSLSKKSKKRGRQSKNFDEIFNTLLKLLFPDPPPPSTFPTLQFFPMTLYALWHYMS